MLKIRKEREKKYERVWKRWERERAIRLWSTYRGCKLVVPYKEEETSTNPPLVSFSSRLPAKRVTRFTIHRTRREPPQGEICETSEEIFRRLFPRFVLFLFFALPRFSSLRPMFHFMICLRSELFFRRLRDRSELLFRISCRIESNSLSSVPLFEFFPSTTDFIICSFSRRLKKLALDTRVTRKFENMRAYFEHLLPIDFSISLKWHGYFRRTAS